MNINDIIRGLKGVLRIMLLDPEASNHFDLDSKGFLRSFGALVVSLPVLLFSTVSSWRLAQAMEDNGGVIAFGPFAALQLGSNILYWAIYLISLVYIARFLELRSGISAYIITFNWGTLFFALLFALPLFFYSLGLFNETGTAVLFLPLFTGLVWYRWQIAREVLGATVGAAIAIVIFDLVLGAVIDMGLSRLFYG